MRPQTIAAALGFFVVVVVVVARYSKNESAPASPTDAGLSSDGGSPDQAWYARHRTEPAEPRSGSPGPASGHVAVAVNDHPGEDELTLRWDELPRSGRVMALTQRFKTALRAIQQGGDLDDLDRNRAEADAALAALRAEMYADPAGRDEHRRLEQQLEAMEEKTRGAQAVTMGVR